MKFFFPVTRLSFSKIELVTSKTRTLLLLLSDFQLMFADYELHLTSEDSRVVTSKRCDIVFQHLYCHFDSKLVDGVVYKVSSVHFLSNEAKLTVPLSGLSFIARTHAQESISFEITPETIFIMKQQTSVQIEAKSINKLLGFKVAYCSIRQLGVSLISKATQIGDAFTCEFPSSTLRTASADVTLFNSLGHELFSESLRI